MKAFLLTAILVAAGAGLAHAEAQRDTMRDPMMQHEEMMKGDTMQSQPDRMASHAPMMGADHDAAYRAFWLKYNGGGGGG